MRNNEIRTVYHPGVYLSEYLEEMHINQNEFAIKLGINEKQVSLILKGKTNITSDIAKKLSMVIGTSSNYWLNLQAIYDEYLDLKEKTSV
jgi:addiction module HigA family antidote